MVFKLSPSVQRGWRTWERSGDNLHFSAAQPLRLSLQCQVLANAKLTVSSQVFYVACFGSSWGPQFSPAPTAISIQDDFRSCPTFPTSDASWAFPGNGGQEIKLRAMLYICGNRGSSDTNLPMGSTRELLPLFKSSFHAHKRKNTVAPIQRSLPS